ncbi:MAG: hypothetical protein ACYTEW_19665 [Planctomycetota bacterium]|jgi:hypothetical protein
MAYKFQLGDAILSGALKQEGDIDIIESGVLKIGSTQVIDAQRNVSGNTLDGTIINPAQAFGNADTGDLVEGSNLYFTDARARAAISEDADVLTYNNSTGVMGIDAAEFTASARRVMSVTESDVDALSTLQYDSATGVLTFDGLGADEIRQQMSADGDLISYDNSTGVISSVAANFTASWDVKMAAADTGDLAEGSNLYFTDARARAAISESDDVLTYNSGTGVMGIDAAALTASARRVLSVTESDVDALSTLQYDDATGVLTFDGLGADEIRQQMSADGDLVAYDNSTGVISTLAGNLSASWDVKMAAADTGDLAEGSNLYFTDARARAAISESDDVLTYNNSTGVIGIDAQALTASARRVLSVTESDVDALSTLQYDDATGVLTFDGLGADEIRQQMSADGDLVSYDNATGVISTVAANLSASWDVKMAAADTGDLAEGSNLYFTDARARAAISESDDVLTYDNSTGVMGIDAAAFTASARRVMSVTESDVDALSTLQYNSATGVLTFDGLGADEIRQQMSADGDLVSYDNATGVISSVAANFSASWDVKMAAADTDDLAEGPNNLYFTDARARAAISEQADFLSYDNSTGVMSVVAGAFSGSSIDAIGDATAAPAVRGHFSAGEMLDLASGEYSINGTAFSGSVVDVVADASAAAAVRSHLAVSDTDSIDMSYNSGTGVFSADLRINSGDGDNSFELVTNGGLRLKSSVAGAGLTLSSGVLSLDGAVVTGHGDANASLAEGFNYGSADLTADRTWTLPATPAAGDVVHVKAPLVGSNKLIIAAGAGDNIDGVASIEIESDSGAVSLMAISDSAWRIF